MEVTRIGLDIAKNLFQVHGVNQHGKTIITKQLRRAELMPFFAQLTAKGVSVDIYFFTDSSPPKADQPLQPNRQESI